MTTTTARVSTARSRVKARKLAEPIAIVWVSSKADPQDPTYSLLAYNGGNGDVRTYVRDEYDARCGANLPFFGSWLEADNYMRGAPLMAMCQVPVSVLRTVFSGLRFASV